MEIIFNDELITGNKTIDEQHKELIDRIGKFVTACENNAGKIKAIKMLDYLSDYTEFHFNAEEELQKNVNYPGFEEHHVKHEEFKKTVKELHEYLEEIEDPDDKFIEAVKVNVVDWLLYHIKGFDRSVAEFIFITENPDII